MNRFRKPKAPFADFNSSSSQTRMKPRKLLPLVALVIFAAGLFWLPSAISALGDNPAPSLQTQVCQLVNTINVQHSGSAVVYDECLPGTTPTTTVASTTTESPTTTLSGVYELGTWSFLGEDRGPIWRPPAEWYPDSRGARIGVLQSDGTYDYGSRDDEGFDETGPNEGSEFHYWNHGWQYVSPGSHWRVDGHRVDGSPFEEFWTAPGGTTTTVPATTTTAPSTTTTVYVPDPTTPLEDITPHCDGSLYPCAEPLSPYPTTSLLLTDPLVCHGSSSYLSCELNQL